MPTGLLDYSGFGYWFRNEDGEFVPIRDIQTMTLSPNDEAEFERIMASDYTFSITVHLPKRAIKRILKHLRRSENHFRRGVRREIRRREKERRRRLKEVGGDA
jgi:hypothetical protein